MGQQSCSGVAGGVTDTGKQTILIGRARSYPRLVRSSSPQLMTEQSPWRQSHSPLNHNHLSLIRLE